MSYPRRLSTLLLALASPFAAHGEGDNPAAPRPLDLSLPRDAVWTTPVRPELSGRELIQSDPRALPDIDAANGSAGGRRGGQPYGTGYEARQRGGGGADGQPRGKGRGR